LSYLTKAEIDSEANRLSIEFEQLMKEPRFVARPTAKQWAFFRHCFSVLLGRVGGDFPCSKGQAIQYKYEITDRLERYYLTTSNPVKYVFKLVDEDDATLFEQDGRTYPSANGYRLLVIQSGIEPLTAQEKRAVVESVVTHAIDAEWAVYKRLPALDLTPLDGLFVRDGSAYNQIYNVALMHSKKSWTISNPMNSSVKRLLNISVEEITDEFAEVRTSEYWRLAWWSLAENRYVKIYKEENRQKYFLIFQDNCWLIKDNIYPPPKTSPRRWRK
jgi:hypothetical protein